MKLKSIQLHPFAGLKNDALEFSDGLNLILGPNEAGKSTVFKAIQHGLLTTTSLTKSKLVSEMGDLFPLSGGDVIRITIELYLDNPDEYYTIKKEWKPGNRKGSASLVTSDGNEFTDQEKVQEMIEQLLPVKPGTMKEILLSQQSSLHTSLSRVKKSDHIKQEIGGILRKSVMEAGGVSVDQFKQTLDEQFENHFNNWDRDKNYPQTDASGNDRAIHNPHKRNVGIVLKAWYKKEKENKNLDQILKYEDEIDTLNKQRENVNQELQEKRKILEELKPKLEQQTERAILEGQKENVESRLEEISRIAELWPVYEYQLKESEPKLKALENRLITLNSEQEKASKKSELSILKQRKDKLKELEKNIEEFRGDLEETKKVTEEDVERLRALKQDILQKRTKIEASNLSVKIEALADLEVSISDAEGAIKEVKLQTGDEEIIEEKGLFSLKTNQINLEVIAGKEDVSSIAEQLRELQNKQADLFESFEATDLSEVISLRKLYQDKVNRLESLQEQWNEHLGDDSLEEFKEKLREAGDLLDVRSLEVIQQERDQVLEEKSTLKTDVDKKRTDIYTWTEVYTDKNGLFTKRAELTSKIKELRSKIEETQELPEEFDTLNGFKAHVETVATKVEELREKKQELDLKAAEKEGQDPGISSEEQKMIVEEAESSFERIHSKAESIARVKERTDALLAKLEQQTYKPLSDGLMKWLAIMSNNRFTDITLDKGGKEVPSAFSTSDDKEIPFNLLSHGTKDLTALAWKLAVSEKFLVDQSSVILLDDPMVDMDPKRKEMAAKALDKFAGDQQIILFSCHPEMGKYLGWSEQTIQI